MVYLDTCLDDRYEVLDRIHERIDVDEPVRRSSWAIPRHADVEAILGELYEGHWELHASPMRLPPVPSAGADLWAPRTFHDVRVERPIPAALLAHPDDVDWLICATDDGRRDRAGQPG
jgi:hypothetical protein